MPFLLPNQQHQDTAQITLLINKLFMFIYAECDIFTNKKPTFDTQLEAGPINQDPVV